MTKIYLANLQAQHLSLKPALQDAVKKVLESERYVNGPEKELFELEFSSFLECRFAVGTSSGTDAMALGLKAMGVGEGDDVIVPANSFQANAEAVILVGARPVLCDVELETGLMNVHTVEKAWTENTRAVIAVHLWGYPIDLNPIIDLAKDRGAYVVENGAQAIGSQLGKAHVGTMGDVGAFSFFPGNTLGGMGDGGMLVTDSQDVAIAARAMGNHGRGSKTSPVGRCSRLDEIQAAVCRVKMKVLGKWIDRRRKIEEAYRQGLTEVGDIALPVLVHDAKPVLTFAVIATKKRDALKDHLHKRGIVTNIHYPKPIHIQNTYHFLGYEPGSFPNSEKLCQRVLSLPCYPEMTNDDLRRVISEVRGFFNNNKSNSPH